MYDENVRKNGFLPNYVPLFSHRPQVMAAWGQLLGSITRPMDKRRYELITLAAARALTSSYCMLAHGSVLLQFYAGEQLEQIANDYRAADLTPAEIGMMAFAEQIARNATAVTQDDVAELRELGFSDGEIFEIAATAAARCFFSKLLDALGAQADSKYLDLDRDLQAVLTVGRPISER